MSGLLDRKCKMRGTNRLWGELKHQRSEKAGDHNKFKSMCEMDKKARNRPSYDGGVK